MADVMDVLDFTRTIRPVAGPVLARTHLRKFGFPVAQDMGLKACHAAHLRDRIIQLAFLEALQNPVHPRAFPRNRGSSPRHKRTMLLRCRTITNKIGRAHVWTP